LKFRDYKGNKEIKIRKKFAIKEMASKSTKYSLIEKNIRTIFHPCLHLVQKIKACKNYSIPKIPINE
jgi:predicted nucleotide-binding protein (sugar kinase/HSP70/actin superfamily)